MAHRRIGLAVVALCLVFGGCTVETTDDDDGSSGAAGEGGEVAQAGDTGDSGETGEGGNGQVAGAAGEGTGGAAGESNPETGGAAGNAGQGQGGETAGEAGNPAVAGAAGEAGGEPTAGNTSIAGGGGVAGTVEAGTNRPVGIGRADAGAAGVAGGDAIPEGPDLDAGSRAAARAIQEADIIQVRNDRLYALSEVGGLSIIDVGTQDQLSMLGRYRTDAKPFEMFIRGETVFALFNDAVAWDENELPVGTTSRVIVLNVADPASVTEISSFNLPGQISDSRIVGDILYVGSYKSVGCYYCETSEVPVTTILSMNISDPENVTEVDRLNYEETSGDMSAERLTITANDQRMFVSSVQEQREVSTIQVIDISDPAGDLVQGATVDVQGAIFSRWQMDEYMGILRVISQPPSWDTSIKPMVETFEINSSSDITKLGELELTAVPEREELRSVRFDGPTAYAVTFLNTDPMYTIDLSDPANPTQPGALEMPGWLFYMEPLENIAGRMLALGFDNTSEVGALNVSLINTEDIAAPTLVERVEFGGEWSASVAEDQDRIHKLFNVLEDLHMVLVPYSGWTGESDGCGSYGNGIQIMSYDTDDLTLNGIAKANGTARRAFIYDERLFSVSTDYVQTFNMDDLDNPTQTASLGLAMRVHRTVPVGDKVLRIRSERETRVASADLVPLASAEQPSQGESLDLVKALLPDTTNSDCYYYDDSPYRNSPAFVFGTQVALVIPHYGPSGQVGDVLVIDTAGDTPTVTATVRLPAVPATSDLGESAVKLGNLLIIQANASTSWDTTTAEPSLMAVDFTDPANPELLDSLDRPEAWGVTGLSASGTSTSSGYFLSDDEVGVRYFLDQVSWASDGTATPMEALELPGLLLGALGDRHVVVDFAWENVDADDSYECEQRGGEFTWGDGEDVESSCWVAHRRLNLVDTSVTPATVLSSTGEIDTSLRLAAVHSSETRYFLPAVAYESSQTRERVVVAGVDGDGNLQQRVVALARTPVSSTAVGDKLYLINGPALGVVDATNVTEPHYVRLAALDADTGMHLAISGNTALISLGDAGVQAVTLP